MNVSSCGACTSAASMSTIHPILWVDAIKQRVKKTITKQQNQNVQTFQRIRAKGKASAATSK